MSDIDFLSVQDVLLAHTDQIARYDGDPSVRDLGLLESAIAQPQATFGQAYLHVFPFEMAAAYMFHIVQNHPFVDGNKRTGVVAALLFLELNEVVIDAPAGSIYEKTIAVADGRADKREISLFFERIAVTR
jgi:death on curing protein